MTVHQTKSGMCVLASSYFSPQLVTVHELFNGFYWDLDRPGIFLTVTTPILLSRVTGIVTLPLLKKRKRKK